MKPNVYTCNDKPFAGLTLPIWIMPSLSSLRTFSSIGSILSNAYYVSITRFFLVCWVNPYLLSPSKPSLLIYYLQVMVKMAKYIKYLLCQYLKHFFITDIMVHLIQVIAI